MNWILIAKAGAAVVLALGLLTLGLKVKASWDAGQAAKACVKALERPAGPDRAAFLPHCPKKVQAMVRRAETDADAAGRAASCAAGLRRLSTGPDAGAWTVPTVCPRQVKDLDADRSARAAEVAGRDRELQQVRANQAAAINRAANRAAVKARGEANANRTIPTLPAAGDGRRRADAAGLCALAGC